MAEPLALAAGYDAVAVGVLTATSAISQVILRLKYRNVVFNLVSDITIGVVPS